MTARLRKATPATTNIKIRATTLTALNQKRNELKRKLKRPFSQSDTIDWLVLKSDMDIGNGAFNY